MSPRVAAPLRPPAATSAPVAPQPLASIAWRQCSGSGHSDRCVAASYCCFHFHLPDDLWCGYFAMACLRILLTLSFVEQKHLMKCSLSPVSSTDRAFGIVSESPCHKIILSRSSRFSSVLSFRGFIILHFTLRSVTHFVKHFD